MSARSAPWDAIVVGAGHNGLVCATYLARAGLRTLVLERRDVLGGAAETSEVAPGARVPTLAHTVGRMAPAVVRELNLAGHGLRLVQPAALVTSVRPDGEPLTLWSDPARTARGLSGFSRADAEGWVTFDREIRALASALWRVLLMTPPDLDQIGSVPLAAGLRFGWRYRRLSTSWARAFGRALPQPVADFLEDRLESEPLRALIAARALRFNRMGPHMAGTTAVLLTDSAGNGAGAAGETVYARGGPGTLATALATAARAAGVTIRTGAEVAVVRDSHEHVRGVALRGGEEIEAPVVVSAIDPRATLLGLVDPETLGPELGWEAEHLRDRGATAKVNLALSRLPAFQGLDGATGAERLRGRIVVAPSMAYLDQAAGAVKYGRASQAPWLEATIPSLVDPLLVDGRSSRAVAHVMSVIVQSAPYDLREGSWDTQRDALGDRVIETLAHVAPGFGDLVVAREVLTPLDLERVYGLSGGHPMHLEPSLDQWFAWRPLLGLARYRLRPAGLYLCAAGAHPGGGLTGLPGRHAAGAVLTDARPRRARPRRPH